MAATWEYGVESGNMVGIVFANGSSMEVKKESDRVAKVSLTVSGKNVALIMLSREEINIFAKALTEIASTLDK